MRSIERDVVGVFVFSSDNCLLLGKSIGGGVYQDTWLVPGGGIKPGETKVKAAIRELQEETGLLVEGSSIQPLEGQHKGQSEKTLRETGEEVQVIMTFWDYRVDLDKPSTQLEVTATDDLKEVEWFEEQELARLALAAGTRARLQKMNLI